MAETLVSNCQQMNNEFTSFYLRVLLSLCWGRKLFRSPSYLPNSTQIDVLSVADSTPIYFLISSLLSPCMLVNDVKRIFDNEYEPNNKTEMSLKVTYEVLLLKFWQKINETIC